MLKLSFVLPCYNVERYIADCLDSIYAQDMPEDEYEVICVNDCSTDATRSIIVDYSLKHSNLTLIDHEQNMTVGGARNTGLGAAKGEYVWFVDPDDLVELNSADALYEMAKEKDVDLLMFNFETVDEVKHSIKKDCSFPNSNILGGQDFVVKYFPNCFSRLSIVWRCLFRTSFIREKELYYPRLLKAEDVSFLWKAFLMAERVASVNGIFYAYRRNPHSIGKNELNARVAFSEQVLFAYEIYKLLKLDNLNIIPIVRNDMENTLRWCVNSNLELINQMTNKERIRYYDEIKSNLGTITYIWPYMNKKHKRVFSVACGRRLWLIKVKLLAALKKQQKND